MRGQVPYDYLSLLKVLLLQQWHQLSDPKMEEALHTRIDFMWFTGFGLADKEMHVPDETRTYALTAHIRNLCTLIYFN